MNVNALPSHNETAVGGREEAGNSVVVVVVVAAGRGQRTVAARDGIGRRGVIISMLWYTYIHTWWMDGLDR